MSIGRTKIKKRSWREKLADSKDFPKIAKIDSTKSKQWGTGTFVIPAPLEVDAAMRKVRRGKLTTIYAIRRALAKRHGTTIACPRFLKTSATRTKNGGTSLNTTLYSATLRAVQRRRSLGVGIDRMS